VRRCGVVNLDVQLGLGGGGVKLERRKDWKCNWLKHHYDDQIFVG